jgi:hypothetical protein
MISNIILLLYPLGIPSAPAKRQDVNVDLEDLSLSQFIREALAFKTQEPGNVKKSAVVPINLTLNEKEPLRTKANKVKVVREENKETDFQAPQDKPPLTEEQRFRMEENRKMAIQRRNWIKNHSSNTCPPYLTENKSTIQKKFSFKPVKRPENKENVNAVKNPESNAEQSLEDMFDRNEKEWNQNPRYDSGVPKEKKTKDEGNGRTFVSFTIF